jgi:hypothetical protein
MPAVVVAEFTMVQVVEVVSVAVVRGEFQTPHMAGLQVLLIVAEVQAVVQVAVVHMQQVVLV